MFGEIKMFNVYIQGQVRGQGLTSLDWSSEPSSGRNMPVHAVFQRWWLGNCTVAVTFPVKVGIA